MNSDLSDVDDIRLVPRACYLENGRELHNSFARSWWIGLPRNSLRHIMG
jgi:hypothetical protein